MTAHYTKRQTRFSLRTNDLPSKIMTEDFEVEAVDLSLKDLGNLDRNPAVFVLSDNEEDIFDVKLNIVSHSPFSELWVGNLMFVDEQPLQKIPDEAHVAVFPYNWALVNPYDSIYRLRAVWVILHESGLKTLLFPWQILKSGEQVIASYNTSISKQQFKKNPKKELNEILSIINHNAAAGNLKHLQHEAVYLVLGTVEDYDVYKIAWN